MTRIFPPGKFPTEGSPPLVSHPEHSPHEKYAWKQRSLALEITLICCWREPVPTRVLNPNASEASCKPKQRSYRKTKLNFFFFFRGDFPGTLSREPHICVPSKCAPHRSAPWGSPPPLRGWLWPCWTSCQRGRGCAWSCGGENITDNNYIISYFDTLAYMYSVEENKI